MTDNDLLACVCQHKRSVHRNVLERDRSGRCNNIDCDCTYYAPDAARLAVALRARDTELAAARTLIYDLAGPDWLTAAAGLALQERARAWLASVSPPADGEEP